MNEELKNTKWYFAYDLLADALFGFYSDCKKKKQDPGEELYKLLINNSRFVENNKWIEKFEMKFGVNSLDPIHVFASFNGSKSSDIIRKEKIIYLLDLLNPKHGILDIDFEGCPTPMVIHILGARDNKDQIQVWDLF